MKEAEEHQTAHCIKQVLNESIDKLPSDVVSGLRKSRLTALDVYRQHSDRRGISRTLTLAAHPLRIMAMTLALGLGATGAYYWNQFQQASENEEIDSDLLSDELPPEIYTDSGFHSWLEHSRSSSLP